MKIKLLILSTLLLSTVAMSKGNVETQPKNIVNQYETVVINYMGNADKVSKKIAKLLNKMAAQGWVYKSQLDVDNRNKRSLVFIFSRF